MKTNEPNIGQKIELYYSADLTAADVRGDDGFLHGDECSLSECEHVDDYDSLAGAMNAIDLIGTGIYVVWDSDTEIGYIRSLNAPRQEDRVWFYPRDSYSGPVIVNGRPVQG